MQQKKELKNTIICHNIRLIPGALRKFYDREDYFSLAYLTLDKCVDRFNPNLGFCFNTYAVNSVFRECARAKQDDLSKSAMTYSITDTEATLVDSKNKDLIAIDNDDLTNYIKSIVNTLDTRDRDVMVRFFGLFGTEKETLEQIASRYCISKERIRQIKDKVLRRFYKEMRTMPVLTECI